MRFTLKTFSQLSTLQLYEILKLRAEVFVVEQECWYQDLDDKDKEAYHILGWEKNKLCAYARIVAKGISYKNAASIGRVVTSKDMRRKGAGLILMKEAITQCNAIHPQLDIKISAQFHLTGFYAKLGFQIFGEQYLEDNIPHIGMLLRHNNKE